MEHINWTALAIMVIWISAAIATAFSKDSSCMGAAAITTLILGFGWFLLKF